MSNYNSENTTILATHEQAGGNKRMLLLHVCENGRKEYVIGSYFTVGERLADEGWKEYSWDWGHYFSSFEKAARYWLDEVIGVEFGFEAYDERSGFSEGEVFVELGDAIDAYVNWDFLDGGKKKRIYSVIGEEQVTLVEYSK